MKKLFLFIVMLSLLANCSIRKNTLVHYLSTLENIKVLPPTKEESLIIDSLEQDNKQFVEQCKKNGWNCIVDNPRHEAFFKTGAAGFRQIIFNQFKVNTETRVGENKMLVTVGKKNSIESIVFLKYTDKDSKRQIENIFQSREINKWSSAKIYGIPVKEQFEISIFIEER